ncbi:3-oxoacyl-ACP synthase [Galbibacter sp. PAP.153]|uniref:3-oxoacyl-ACP synthase n=1 Tax=Galbibacter sp. PAP.153 TaxID=3104623 RepID=UPI0030090B39
MDEIKQQFIKECLALLNKRMYQIQKSIKSIEESLASETKSSAGDKHETGRAMLQLEREKAGFRLKEIEEMLQTFSRINFNRTSEENNKRVIIGSMVKTSGHTYFIAVSLGEIIINNLKIYCISPQSPIGKLLVGKTNKDIVSFQSSKFTILEIW